ncbi:MAG: hypothetical protein OXG47_05775 [bacterium]|nr:hypothetical protein [bacterium]MCY3925208.1 hypothetical protein [bacterium]
MGALGPLLALARRRGIARGLFGTSTGWLLAALVAWGLRGLRRALRPATPGVQSVSRLRPGERLVVTHGPRRGPRQGA